MVSFAFTSTFTVLPVVKVPPTGEIVTSGAILGQRFAGSPANQEPS